MTFRLLVGSAIPDTRAAQVLSKAHARGLASISQVALFASYTVDKTFSQNDRQTIASILTNPVTEVSSLDDAGGDIFESCAVGKLAATQPPAAPPHTFPALLDTDHYSWLVEIGYLPGVTDNIAHTVMQNIQACLGCCFSPDEAVYSSTVYLLGGDLDETVASQLAAMLANPLIQSIHTLPIAKVRQQGLPLTIPKVHLTTNTDITTIDLNLPDDQLELLSRAGIADPDGTRRGPLALTLPALHAIRSYFAGEQRLPTDAELETLAQTWSEHCKHTLFASPIDDISDGIFRHYIKRATTEIRKQKGADDFCISVFTDNAGGIVFDDEWLITDKVETHNSPSALDPYGGAITGIIGVNRDALGFGLGAKPVINRYGFCFGLPDDTEPLYRDAEKTNPMLPPRRIAEDVIAGVKDGGNQSGIPTPQGFCYFDSSYKGKPLVFVGTVGLIPRKIGNRPGHEKAARPGDLVVMLGGRVGLDGIHGATFSSEALSAGSPATAVQIGDAITQKKFSDMLVKDARERGLYTSITDNGAGGLSSSVGEMARESGGCLIHLDQVPLKYPGLAPWQIWISESQERMTLAVPPEKLDELLTLCTRHGVEATAIGTFTDTGRCQVVHHGKHVVDISLEFLHDGLPLPHLKTKSKPYAPQEKRLCQKPGYSPDSLPKSSQRGNAVIGEDQGSMKSLLLALLARPSIASFSFISRQYDHEVQAGSVLKPLQGKGDVNAYTTITRPVLSSQRGVVLSQGLSPRSSNLDPYRMAALAIDAAVRNVIAAGGSLDHLALLDNFCWCSGNDPYRLWQLKEAARGCYDYAVAFGTPFISGKDSMFNDFTGFDEAGQPVKISVLPTLLISAIGVIEDSELAVSMDVKMPGDLVYLLGATTEALGGAEITDAFPDLPQASMPAWDTVPTVDAADAITRYRVVEQAIRRRLIASAEGVGLGGLGVALARASIAGQLGMEVEVDTIIFAKENLTLDAATLTLDATLTPDAATLTLDSTLTPALFQRERELEKDRVKDSTILFAETPSRILITINPRHQDAFEALLTEAGTAWAKIGRVTEDPTLALRSGGELVDSVTVAELGKAYGKRWL